MRQCPDSSAVGCRSPVAIVLGSFAAQGTWKDSGAENCREDLFKRQVKVQILWCAGISYIRGATSAAILGFTGPRRGQNPLFNFREFLNQEDLSEAL